MYAHTEDYDTLPRRNKALMFGGRLMLAWAILGLPLTSLNSFAQGFPTTPTTTELKDAAQQMRTDDATSNTLINKRASRLLNGQYKDNSPLRGPKIIDDGTEVRSPKIIADPNEAARAAAAAAKAAPPKSRQEIVSGAQAGSNVGMAVYPRADAGTTATVNTRAEPGVNDTSGNRVNINQVMPGFRQDEVQRLHNLGADMFNNPSDTKAIAEKARKNMRRDGCRKTDFVMKSLQNIDLAPNSPEHRILKVEFFDVTKEPITGTNPVEYKTVTTPTTYKRGNVNWLVPTLGAASTVYWDIVDDSYAIRYTYTPYTEPLNRNYFTYNHWFGLSHGGGVERVYDPGLVSYGSPNDGWKPVASKGVPLGVTAAYLSADLYQTDVNYTDASPDQPCPPDPPEVCEVASIGGDAIRWCPNSYGSMIVTLYDDVNNPSPDRYGKRVNDTLAANAQRKDYSSDTAIRAGVIRGVNARSSTYAQQLAGSCTREPISRIEFRKGGSYGVPDMLMCSETLLNPYPEGCDSIKRSFGLSSVGDHNFLTVTAFNKIKVPIIDPKTGKQAKDDEGYLLYTYKKEPANVEGPIKTTFNIMGVSACYGGNSCTTEKEDDPRGTSEGYFVEYSHNPMEAKPNEYVIDGVFAGPGATGEFTDYGAPANFWRPVGVIEGDGSLHQVKFKAKVYMVMVNKFANCERYLDYVADGFCKGGKLTCTDTAPTRKVGDVEFGPDLANHGIVDVLKRWGTDGSAIVDSYYENPNDGTDPNPNGPPILMLEDQMCWAAKAEPFETCRMMDTDNNRLRAFTKLVGNVKEEWETDCNIETDYDDIPLENSPSCKRLPKADTCDTRFEGLFTGQCYNPTLAYDCGTKVDTSVPVIVEEMGDACSGAMRCMGTECHRPNLSGSHNGEFAQAAAGMEAINEMINDMVCEETGEPPTSVNQTCTPFVFGGKPMYCKIPIGNQIGLTPNCCKDTKKAAKGGPSWQDYLQAMSAAYKLGRTMGVLDAIQGSDMYNSLSHTFGEIASPVTDLYTSASSWVTNNIVTPFRAGFDGLMGGQGTSAAGALEVGAAGKEGAVSGLLDQFQQMMYKGIYEVLKSIGGDELAGMIFTTATTENGTELVLTEGMANILLAFQIYSILRLIGHIIFACKSEEYEWAMNDKWRLCTFADTCCAKSVFLLGCVEKRQLYCCYKSIASRVISQQLISKNLTASRPNGFRTGLNGRRLGKCNINCGGFSAYELAAVDWSRVDLTEWTDALIESGLLKPANAGASYGVGQNKLKSSMAIGRNPDAENLYDNRAAAVKSTEILSDNLSEAMEFQRSLKEDVDEHCYVDDKKMPFTYPGCNKKSTSP